MTRYLIEVPHDDNKDACNQAVQAFMETGSHFMTNADWGCGDGEHKAWFIVDLDSKDQAMQILPPLFRENAKSLNSSNSTRRTRNAPFKSTQDSAWPGAQHKT